MTEFIVLVMLLAPGQSERVPACPAYGRTSDYEVTQPGGSRGWRQRADSDGRWIFTARKGGRVVVTASRKSVHNSGGRKAEFRVYCEAI